MRGPKGAKEQQRPGERWHAGEVLHRVLISVFPVYCVRGAGKTSHKRQWVSVAGAGGGRVTSYILLAKAECIVPGLHSTFREGMAPARESPLRSSAPPCIHRHSLGQPDWRGWLHRYNSNRPRSSLPAR